MRKYHATFTLAADAYLFTMRLYDGWTQGRDPLLDRYFDIEVQLTFLHPHEHWHHATDGYVNVADLCELSQYLDTHVRELPNPDVRQPIAPDHPSLTRRPYFHLGGGYELQALTGLRTNDDDGYFTVRTMLDTGQGCPTRTHSSLGGESQISLKAAATFVAELRKFLERQATLSLVDSLAKR